MVASAQLQIDFSLLLILILAIIIGGFLGSLYGAKYANNKRVRSLLAVVLIVAAMKRVIELVV